jgi:hypothetical protein
MMTSDKRERYAQWLRNTGVEHPSDELIDKTQKQALLEIDAANDKKKQHIVKVIALACLSLIVAVCVWLRL